MEKKAMNIELTMIDRKSIVLNGVNNWDFPDFADSYIESAEFKTEFNGGRELTEDELDVLETVDGYYELCNEVAHDMH